MLTLRNGYILINKDTLYLSVLLRRKYFPFLDLWWFCSDPSLSFRLWNILGSLVRAELFCFFFLNDSKCIFSFWSDILYILCLERLSPLSPTEKQWLSLSFQELISNWSNQSIFHIIIYLAASWPSWPTLSMSCRQNSIFWTECSVTQFPLDQELSFMIVR